MSDIVCADIYDQFHAEVDVCDVSFCSYGKRRAFFGRCSTLLTFEDHTSVLSALSEPREGRVLVVDGQGSRRIGVMGDRLAGIGARNGWTGLVINGVIRDSLGIDALDLGVKALGATARRGWAAAPFQRDVELSFGTVRFRPGDWIYADVDSVLVSPRELDLTAVTAAPIAYPEPPR